MKKQTMSREHTYFSANDESLKESTKGNRTCAFDELFEDQTVLLIKENKYRNTNMFA